LEYLIIDTSGTKNFLALISKNNEEIIALPAKDVTKVIHQELLKLNISHISFIAICNGPGFFTGIRIGVSVAKALSYTKKIPLIPFHSLELIESKEDEAKILDARGGKVYAAYQNSAPFLTPISLLRDHLPHDVQKLITLDGSDLSIPGYLIEEKSANLRLKETEWAQKISQGDLYDYRSIKIEYLH